MKISDDLFEVVNEAIDLAFTEQNYNLKLYDYLVSIKCKHATALKIIDSSLATAIDHQIIELNLYLDGGDNASIIKEAYSWMGKPRARKLKEYLISIIEDVKRYEKSRRRGRKPKTEKQLTTSSNK